MENKKISFGFSKIAKKTPNIQQPKIEKAELIECLEGSEIKVKNPVAKVEKTPLIIAIKGNPNNLLGRIQSQALKNQNKKNDEEEDKRPDSELTIEELAARQLIREAKEKLAQKKETAKVHTLPLVDETETAIDAQESTMDDYESVPINDYGMAMLRGMGWKEGMCIGKNQSNFVKPPDPELRPKGLGLGAQKMVQIEPEDVFDKNGKQLILAKGAFAKITAGPHKGTFCEVQGLDDEAGRIIVKMNRTNDILTLNELFVKPVTKEEYALGSKVINNAKYEEYKENEMKPKSDRDSKYGEKSKHRDGKHGFKREESEDYRSRKRRDDESEDSSDEYRRNRSSRHEIKEESDISTDEYKRNRSEKSSNKNDSRKQSKSRYRSRDKYKKERRHSSSESSSDEYYSKRKTSKHTRRRNSEDDNHSKSSKNKAKSNKHKKHSKSRNDSGSD